MYTKLPNGQIVYEQDSSCIIEPKGGKGGIFIGNLQAAQNLNTLKKHGIRAVMTTVKGVTISHSKADVPFYLQIPGEDRDGFDLTCFFPQAIKFIRDSLEKTSIMVHCLAGVSRSVCLVIAYFMKERNMSYNQAYQLVKSKRSIIHPNDGFISQLKQYEAELGRTSSIQARNYDKISSASPIKRRYSYMNEPEGLSYKMKLYQNINEMQTKPSAYYESPSKRSRYHHEVEGLTHAQHYSQTHKPSDSTYPKVAVQHGLHIRRGNGYQSPNRRQELYSSNHRLQLESPTCIRELESSNRRLELESPTRRRELQSPLKRSQYSYLPEKPELSYSRRNGCQTVDPEDRIYHYRGRMSSDMKLSTSQRLFGQNTTNTKYDRFCDKSMIDLSQELDQKIAKIRQKYAQYSKNDYNKSRVQNSSALLDENDLPPPPGLKKITSSFDPRNPEISSIRSTYLKGSGLGLKRLHSMKEEYY